MASVNYDNPKVIKFMYSMVYLQNLDSFLLTYANSQYKDESNIYSFNSGNFIIFFINKGYY